MKTFLSLRTGGAALFVPDGSGAEYVNNALAGCLDFLPSVPSSQKKFSLLQKTYESGKNVEETITIDNFSGKDVSVQIDHDLSPFHITRFSDLKIA